MTGIVIAGTPELSEPKFNFEQVAVLAKGLERTLAARRVRVALIGRLGLRPELMPPGFRFSHAGFAVYSRIETGDGRLLPGYAVYNLYGDMARTSKSHLAQDYPVDYLAIVQRLEVGVVIPNKKLQELLVNTINSGSYKLLHNPEYSVISNPMNIRYQNCTEFVLDVVMSAIYKTADKRVIKANLNAYFKPQRVIVDELKLTMATMTIPEVKVDDHQGPIATTSFSGIARFLMENHIAEEAFVYIVDPDTLYARVEKLEI